MPGVTKSSLSDPSGRTIRDKSFYEKKKKEKEEKKIPKTTLVSVGAMSLEIRPRVVKWGIAAKDILTTTLIWTCDACSKL